MATTENTSTTTESVTMSASAAARVAFHLLDEKAESNERALALAIVLRDRIEGQPKNERDPTDAILSAMIVDHLEGAPENSIKQHISMIVAQAEGGAA